MVEPESAIERLKLFEKPAPAPLWAAVVEPESAIERLKPSYLTGPTGQGKTLW